MAEETPISGAPEYAAALTALIDSARRKLFLYEPTLALVLFNDPGVTRAMTRFMVRSARVQTRILCLDPSSAIGSDCLLIHVYQRFIGRMEIRRYYGEIPPPVWAFAMADEQTWLYRPDPARFDGKSVNSGNWESRRCQKALQGPWDESEPIPDLLPRIL